MYKESTPRQLAKRKELVVSLVCVSFSPVSFNFLFENRRIPRPTSFAGPL